MGVDKSNIRTVIHYEVPATVEAFLQESGRAGRDGRPARSVVLWGAADVVAESRIGDGVQRGRFNQLLGYCSTSACRREYLLSVLGSDCEACFGCDRCNPDALGLDEIGYTVTEAAWTLIDMIRFNPRTLTPDQAIRVIRGRPEAGDRWVPRRLPRPDEMLPDWSVTELAELETGLRTSGPLRRVHRGPWKGRLVAGKTNG